MRVVELAGRVGRARIPTRVWLGVSLLLGVCTPSAGIALGGAARAASLQQVSRTAPLAYGFQGDFFHTASRPQAIGAIRGANFGWAKQQVRWSDYEVQAADCSAAREECVIESIGGRTRYFRRQQLGFLDAVINDLSGAGLRVLLGVVHAPPFAAAAGGHSPTDPRDLGDFVQFLAARYGGKVQAIEPWNEQNLSWEWGGSRLWPNAPAAPPQGVVDFVALQRAAYRGIKAGDPRITVVLPALTPTGLGECWLSPPARTEAFCIEQVRTAIDDRLYLDLLFQVNGGEIKGYYDVLGVHPSGYNNPPDDWLDTQSVPSNSFKGHGSFYIRRYEQLREVQEKHGDTKPMWFTEVGWSVAPRPAPGYEYARDNSEEARGVYVARLLEQVEAEAPYVTTVFLWNLNFRTLVPEADEKYGFGLLNADGSGTPAYLCAADFVKSGNRISRPECRLGSAGARIPTPTVTPTAVAPSVTPTATPTPAPTSTATQSATQTATGTATATATGTATAVPSPAPVGGTAASPAAARETEERTAVSGGQALAPQPVPLSVAQSTGGSTAALGSVDRREHLVVKGDTLFSIARRNGVTVDALVVANGLASRDALLPIGRRLDVPAQSTPSTAPLPPTRGVHTVVKGDTLYSIARRANTSVEALVEANQLGSREAVLRVGRTLVLP